MNNASQSRNLLFLAASVAVLAACGAEEISSPGSGGNISITKGNIGLIGTHDSDQQRERAVLKLHAHTIKRT